MVEGTMDRTQTMMSSHAVTRKPLPSTPPRAVAPTPTSSAASFPKRTTSLRQGPATAVPAIVQPPRPTPIDENYSTPTILERPRPVQLSETYLEPSLVRHKSVPSRTPTRQPSRLERKRSEKERPDTWLRTPVEKPKTEKLGPSTAVLILDSDVFPTPTSVHETFLTFSEDPPHSHPYWIPNAGYRSQLPHYTPSGNSPPSSPTEEPPVDVAPLFSPVDGDGMGSLMAALEKEKDSWVLGNGRQTMWPLPAPPRLPDPSPPKAKPVGIEVGELLILPLNLSHATRVNPTPRVYGGMYPGWLPAFKKECMNDMCYVPELISALTSFPGSFTPYTQGPNVSWEGVTGGVVVKFIMKPRSKAAKSEFNVEDPFSIQRKNSRGGFSFWKRGKKASSSQAGYVVGKSGSLNDWRALLKPLGPAERLPELKKHWKSLLRVYCCQGEGLEVKRRVEEWAQWVSHEGVEVNVREKWKRWAEDGSAASPWIGGGAGPRQGGFGYGNLGRLGDESPGYGVGEVLSFYGARGSGIGGSIVGNGSAVWGTAGNSGIWELPQAGGVNNDGAGDSDEENQDVWGQTKSRKRQAWVWDNWDEGY